MKKRCRQGHLLTAKTAALRPSHQGHYLRCRVCEALRDRRNRLARKLGYASFAALEAQLFRKPAYK